MSNASPEFNGIKHDHFGTCPWCGKRNRALYKTTALLPLKTGNEDLTVVIEYVCSTCLHDAKAERFWKKRVCKEAGVRYEGD